MADTPGWTPPAEPGDQQPGWGTPPGWGAPPPPPPPPGWGQAPGWGQSPAWGQPRGYGAPKPGIIPLRPLGLGEILDGAFAIVREHPAVTLGLSAIVVSVTQLITFAAEVSRTGAGVFGEPGAAGSGFSPQTIVAWIISSVSGLILAGMLTSVVGEAVLGRKTTIGATWAKVRPRFWTLIGAGIVAGIVPFIALIPFIVPGVFLWAAWSFVTPAVVLERVGVGASIRRSWRLAVPDWWRVFGIRLLSILIAGVIGAIIEIPATLAALGSVGFDVVNHDLGVLQLAIITVGSIIAGTITAPFTSGVLALLYIDRRMRAEGLDVTLARAAAPDTA